MRHANLALALCAALALAACGSPPPPARTTTTTTTVEQAPAQPVPATYSSTQSTTDANGRVIKRTESYTTEQGDGTRTQTTVERSTVRDY